MRWVSWSGDGWRDRDTGDPVQIPEGWVWVHDGRWQMPGLQELVRTNGDYWALFVDGEPMGGVAPGDSLNRCLSKWTDQNVDKADQQYVSFFSVCNMREWEEIGELLPRALLTNPTTLKDEYSAESDVRRMLSEMTTADRQELRESARLFFQMFRQLVLRPPNREERRRMARASR